MSAEVTDPVGLWGGVPAELDSLTARAVGPARLSMSFDEAGRFRLSFDAPTAVGALVELAVREAKDGLFAAGQVDVSLADGLVEVANRSLSGVEGTARAGKYRVYVHLDVAGAWIGGRCAIPATVAARFLCEAGLAPVWERGGVPVSVGRTQRIAPARTRRLIEDRDRGCRFPGCASTGHVEIHHLDHWAAGGATDADRMLSLCPHHHDAHHRHEFTITGDPAP